MKAPSAACWSGWSVAIVLVYLLIVVNFQSWTRSVHHHHRAAGRAGRHRLDAVRHRHDAVSVPALTGAIMCMGVATANSILVVSFARERLHDGHDAAAGRARGRLHALPSGADDGAGDDHRHGADGLGLGEGGEQNAPLGRAVIGGLIFATVATLFFVPAVFSLLHAQRGQPQTGPQLENP